MAKICIFLLLLGLQLPVIAHQPEVHTATIYLGRTPIQIRHEYYGPGKVFVHLHANETTALLAGRAVARETSGQVPHKGSGRHCCSMVATIPASFR